MGKLLQALSTKLEKVREERRTPPPDYRADRKKALEYIKRQNDLQFIETALGLKAVGAIQRLPKEKQDEFYEKCIQGENRKYFTKEFYSQRLDPNHSSSKTTSAWLTNDKAFGQDWHKTIETLEEMIGPEEIDRVVAELDDIEVPGDPSMTRQEKMDYPMTGLVQEIKDSLDPNAPGAADDLAMLDEVNEELGVVREEVRAHIDKLDQNAGQVQGIQTMVDGAAYDMQNRFLKQEFEGGKYKDKFPKVPTELSADGERYPMPNTDSSHLKPEDIEELKKHRLTISAPIKNDILTITGKLDALGEQKFRVPGYTIDPVLFGGPDETVFTGEQGYKFYAYWPLYQARGDLAEAVKEKDLAKIRTAHAAYKNIKKEMDEMLAIVQKHPTGLCCGNINSTRSLPDDVANPLPLEHMEDFIGHSQVNGVFLFYALSKNVGTMPEKLLEDPIGVMTEAGKKYVEKCGLNSRKTIGEKLFWGLSSTALRAYFANTWTNHIAQMAIRAFDGLACLADDPAEQARISGTGALAIACSSVAVNDVKVKWNKLVSMPRDQINTLYQHAALVPEDEFDPLEYGRIFSEPDWKQQTDPDALIDRLKKAGKLDYAELAERVEKVVTDSKKGDQGKETKYSDDDFVRAAHTIYKKVLAKASPDERETVGYKKFAESVGSMLTKTQDFCDVQNAMLVEMTKVRSEKSGYFLSSENSEEYKNMVRAQNTFRFKLIQMQGGELPAGIPEQDREYLKTISIQDAYDNAREMTFDYCGKKTDKGRDLSFVHNIGTTRFRASVNSLNYMDALADALSLRSPAQKMIDKVRREVLMGRSQNDWTREKTEKAAAKLMYAMTVANQNSAPEDQTAHMEPKRVEMGVQYILHSDSFKKMMKVEGAKKVLDHIVEGHGKFTNGFVRGMNSLAKERNQPAGKDPKNMTAKEKGEVWKHQALRV